MNTKITFTNVDWNKLEKKAEELYPGKGVTHMITMEINRHLRRIGALESECSDGDKNNLPVVQHRDYKVPDNLVKPMKCVCRMKQIGMASFIARYVLQQHLDK